MMPTSSRTAPPPRRAASACRAVLASACLALAAPAVRALPAQASTPPAPRLELSGILFGNYQYHGEAGAGTTAGTLHNQFQVDRAYVTVRGAAGERGSVRVTTDIFRNGGEGYDVRLKYAYGQYDVLRRGGTTAFVRAGMLQTVMIEHVEQFWPRWLGNVAEDRFGYFASADVGVSAGLTLPRRLGELYATVTNGRGFANAGNDDRFKDVALRVTLTPLAGRADAGLLRTLAISPWYYRGDTASAFATTLVGGDRPDGYLGRIDAGRQRDRFGLFTGIRDPRLTVGLGVSERRSEIESGQNTATSPVVLTTRRERVLSAFTVMRPLAFVDSAAPPIGVVLRMDQFQPQRGTDDEVRFVVAGLTYQLNTNISVALDYQESRVRGVPRAPFGAPTQIYFAHLAVRF